MDEIFSLLSVHKAVHKAACFGELEDELLGTATESNSAASAASSEGSTTETPTAIREPVFERAVGKTLIAGQFPPSGTVVACGVDMQRVDSLPQADDFWEHPFYGETFTKAEIAYCQSRENPAEHFTARWCAKEAVKKCDAAWLRADMTRIEVVLDERGAPSLWSLDGTRRERLPLALSLSHTSEMAIAMVVRGAAKPQQSVSQSQRESPAARADVPVRDVIGNGRERESDPLSPGKKNKKQQGSRFTVFISLLGLAVAGFALWRTFR